MLVRERLWGVLDPYDGAEAQPGCEPVGWGADDPVFEEVVPPDAGLIVEVGSYLGASAIRLAGLAPLAEIVCVDTWLGWADCWSSERSRRSLFLERGYPRIWDAFQANIVAAGLAGRVTPAPMVSGHWWEWARGAGVRPDVVYVDGGHGFRECLGDIEGARSLGAPLIFGHDYASDRNPGVRSAVLYACGRSVEDHGDFWVWRRR